MKGINEWCTLLPDKREEKVMEYTAQELITKCHSVWLFQTAHIYNVSYECNSYACIIVISVFQKLVKASPSYVYLLYPSRIVN